MDVSVLAPLPKVLQLGLVFCRDWSAAGAATAQQQQQLSVVTTVWGVTSSSQSGPHGQQPQVVPTGPPSGYPGSLKQQQQQLGNTYNTGYRQTGPR